MAPHLSSFALAALGLTLLVSCSSGGEAGPGAQVIAVATGAEVTLIFDNFCNSPLEDPLVLGCLDKRPGELGGVTLSGDAPFELGEVSLDNGAVRVTVRARTAGDTTLTVDYTDLSDERHQDRFVLAAADITHVESIVRCDDGPEEVPYYPVTPGAQFSFHLTAMAGDVPLASGDMELIEDAAGFTVLDEPGDFRRAVAPASPGKFVWDLRGSRGLDFVVYSIDDMELTLAEEGGRVRVGRVLGDVPVCVHSGAVRAVFDVTKGACLPFMHGFEIEGGLPVDMALGEFVMELSGKDTCEVTATLGGKSTSITLAVDNLPEPPEAGSGTPLTTTPLSVRRRAASAWTDRCSRCGRRSPATTS